jgi:hypothetical protein
MDNETAQSYYNHLLTLAIRQDQSFGALASAFLRDNNLQELGFRTDEEFNLLLAAAQAFGPEPRRYGTKLEFFERALKLSESLESLPAQVPQQIQQEIQKTKKDLDTYHEAVHVIRNSEEEREKIFIECDAPDYFLDKAQKKANSFYQELHKLNPEAKRAQSYTGPPQKFAPDNTEIHKEFAGACGPFMNALTNAFHVLLPFDIKISRKPDNPLETGVRIFYGKDGYSFPLRYEMGKLCSNIDGEIVEVDTTNPNLRFLSMSQVRTPDFNVELPAQQNIPKGLSYPLTVMQHAGSLGPYVQISTNIKAWFDASQVSLLLEPAPELSKLGIEGASGLLTRTYGLGTTDSYSTPKPEPWKEGLSFNYLNLFLNLADDIEEATIPYNTPICSVYPVLARASSLFSETPNSKPTAQMRTQQTQQTQQTRAERRRAQRQQ